MSGAMRSGLIFGAIGLIAVLATAFVPRPGPIVCGPLLAVLVGGLAGFFGVRWSVENARVSRGVLAALLAGLGMLVGAVIGYIVLFNSISSEPSFQQQLSAFLQQQPDAKIDPEALGALVGIATLSPRPIPSTAVVSCPIGRVRDRANSTASPDPRSSSSTSNTARL